MHTLSVHTHTKTTMLPRSNPAAHCRASFFLTKSASTRAKTAATHAQRPRAAIGGEQHSPRAVAATPTELRPRPSPCRGRGRRVATSLPSTKAQWAASARPGPSSRPRALPLFRSLAAARALSAAARPSPFVQAARVGCRVDADRADRRRALLREQQSISTGHADRRARAAWSTVGAPARVRRWTGSGAPSTPARHPEAKRLALRHKTARRGECWGVGGSAAAARTALSFVGVLRPYSWARAALSRHTLHGRGRFFGGCFPPPRLLEQTGG